MSTVTRELAIEVINNKGYFQDDPRVTHVVVYSNQWNGLPAWAIAYGEQDLSRYFNPENPAVIDPRVVWEAECGGCNHPYGEMAPSHDGSRNCKSGSIASGGQDAHCTCDTCF